MLVILNVMYSFLSVVVLGDSMVCRYGVRYVNSVKCLLIIVIDMYCVVSSCGCVSMV